MKQKLVARLRAGRAAARALLLDEPTTGVDPVSRREFWDTLAHLAADGLTILVATPYLDEAERCHRVALMHLGEIRESGTPAELRSSCMQHGSKCAPRISESGRSSDGRGRPRQRDHRRAAIWRPARPVMHDPDEGRAAMPSKSVEISGYRGEGHSRRRSRPSRIPSSPRYAPWGRKSHGAAIPRQTSASRSARHVAIEAENLTKRFGAFIAVNNINVEVSYGEIYGLLGANGAGKTTTIKMLCGLLDPTSGRITLAGEQRKCAIARRAPP